jgi:opacity protein-like surface antigen
MRATLVIGVAAVAFAATTSTALAQTSAKPAAETFRGYVSANGGYQATSTDFRDTVAFTEFLEEAQVESSYSVSTGPQLDVAGAVRLWRLVGVGVGVTRFSRTGGASVAAEIPHPFFFDRPRAIEGEASGLKREELAVHLQAVAFLPTPGRFSVALFGGPSLFSVKQGLVSRVEYNQEYPYDTAAFSGTRTDRASESNLGFNAGADVGFFLSRNVGVGGVIRFSRAAMELTSADGDSVTFDAGGFQAGGGLRLRF